MLLLQVDCTRAVYNGHCSLTHSEVTPPNIDVQFVGQQTVASVIVHAGLEVLQSSTPQLQPDSRTPTLQQTCEQVSSGQQAQ